jgi:opacity protein-like surface antigen
MRKFLVLTISISISTFAFAQQNFQDSRAGYQGIVEIGHAIGIDYKKKDFLKVNVINGYKFNPYFSLGLGTGIKYYYDAKDAMVPLFMDFRAKFIDKKVSPYFTLDVGYLVDVTRNAEIKAVGPSLNPIAGVRFKISDKSAIYLGIGYELQRVENYQYWIGIFTAENTSYVGINAGISF